MSLISLLQKGLALYSRPSRGKPYHSLLANSEVYCYLGLNNYCVKHKPKEMPCSCLCQGLKSLARTHVYEHRAGLSLCHTCALLLQGKINLLVVKSLGLISWVTEQQTGKEKPCVFNETWPSILDGKLIDFVHRQTFVCPPNCKILTRCHSLHFRLESYQFILPRHSFCIPLS